MKKQQMYRLLYALRILTCIPALFICFLVTPIYWIVTGNNLLDSFMDDWMEYKEPKKPNQAIVGDSQEPEIWNRSNRIGGQWQRDTIFSPPPKPIPPPKPNIANDQTDKYEY
jgi:hypothetical protein